MPEEMLESVKMYLRLDGNLEDDLLLEMIAAAMEDVKTASGKSKTADGQDIAKAAYTVPLSKCLSLIGMTIVAPR